MRLNQERPRPSRAAAGLPPVTPDRVIVAATRLTEAHGLEHWGLRQLARELEVGPRVIYHHVGDREAVAGRVVARVLEAVPTPPESLPWREWFETLLLGSRPVLRRYPGVARRIVLSGPVTSAGLAHLELGMRVLGRAGFGPDAVAVYRYLLNSAYLLIAVEDERAEFNPGGRVELAATLLSRQGPQAPGLSEVAREVSSRGLDPTSVAEVDEQFFRYAVCRSIDGVAVSLRGPGTAGSE
jgi:AcrR family transcriptional regulator